MENKQSLLDFLEDQLPTYNNPNGVQVYLNTDSSLFICCNYPDFKQLNNISIELFQEVKSLKALINLLNISLPEQISNITPTHLLNLYNSGCMNIACTQDLMDLSIHFRRYKNKVRAKDMAGRTHQVNTQLDKADDFITYTLNYYNITDKSKYENKNSQHNIGQHYQ